MNEEQVELNIEEEEEDVENSEQISNNNQNELHLLRTEIHNKSESLKKCQNDYKNLRKKYRELLDLMKKKDSKVKKQDNQQNDLLKWKSTWEKVISQMTEIVPFIIPKETNPDQQRKILYELTNRLCQVVRNSTQTTEYQNLKSKYLRNKQKLIKLKEQCNSLLDIIQSKKNQAARESQRYYYNYDDDDDIIYGSYRELNNHRKNSHSKFYFQPVHDDIYLNRYEKENSPTIQNLYYQEKKLNQNIYNHNSKSNKSKTNNFKIGSPTPLQKNHYSSNIQKDDLNNNEIISSMNENKNEFSNNMDDQLPNEENINANENIQNVSHGKPKESKINADIQISPQKTDFTFSNLVIADVQSTSNRQKLTNESNSLSSQTQNKVIKSRTKEKKQSTPPQNFQKTEISKEVTSNVEFQKNDITINQKNNNSNALNEFNKIDQEFSENEAEEVLNELESRNSSSTTTKEVIKSSSVHHHITNSNNFQGSSEKNIHEKKKSAKKDLINYQIKYGNSVNELIDITNRLRDRYYEVNKKYGHSENNLEFSKENNITKIQDPLLNQ